MAFFDWWKRQKKKSKQNKTVSDRRNSWRVKEAWEDYPTPNYSSIHTYCKVIFEENGKGFYYRTRNPDLKVGDMVYVPVGYNYEEKIGKIISMKTMWVGLYHIH